MGTLKETLEVRACQSCGNFLVMSWPDLSVREKSRQGSERPVIWLKSHSKLMAALGPDPGPLVAFCLTLLSALLSLAPKESLG